MVVLGPCLIPYLAMEIAARKDPTDKPQEALGAEMFFSTAFLYKVFSCLGATPKEAPSSQNPRRVQELDPPSLQA